jgi:glycosyltransferase 2 family protein
MSRLFQALRVGIAPREWTNVDRVRKDVGFRGVECLDVPCAPDMSDLRRVALRSVRAVARSPLTRGAGTLLAVLLLLHSMDLSKTARGFRDARPAWVGFGVLLTAVSVIGSVLQWGVLVRGGDHRLRWRSLFSWHLQGLFMSQILPSGLGGDALRAVEVGRVIGHGHALASLCGSRMAGALGIALWGIAGTVVLRGWLGLPGVAAAALFAVAMVVAWVAALLGDRLFPHGVACDRSAWRRRLGTSLHSFSSALGAYRRRPWALVQSLSLGAASWGVNLVALGALARSVDVDATWLVFSVAIPLTLVTTLAPFSLNGIGLREGVLIGLLMHFGVSTAHAGALSVLIDVQTAPFAMLGAVFWMRQRMSRQVAPSGLTKVRGR